MTGGELRMCTIELRNDGLEALPSPSPLCTAEPGYTIHTPLDGRHFKSLHERISIFGLDTEGMDQYICLA